MYPNDDPTPSPAPIEHILQYFAYEHLPPHLQEISKPFCELAAAIAEPMPQHAGSLPGFPLPRNPERTVASGAAAQLPVRPPTATATTTTRPATTPKTPPMQRIQPAIASTVAGSLPAVAANNSDERYVLESKIEMYMQYFGDELQTTIGVNWSNKSTDQLRKICDDCERRLSIGGERELVAHATTGLAYGMEMMAPVLPAPLTYAVGFHELVKTQVDDPKSPIGRAVTRLGIRYLGRLPANHPFMALAGALALTMWRMGDAVSESP
jgi:hypothetical protein